MTEDANTNADRSHANVAHRREQINAAMRKQLDLERRIDELKAEHIKPLQEEIRQIKQAEIKGDLGVKLKAYNAHYRLYRIEHEAKGYEDEADRDTLLDSLREVHEAMSIGQTVDFVDVMTRQANQPTAA